MRGLDAFLRDACELLIDILAARRADFARPHHPPAVDIGQHDIGCISGIDSPRPDRNGYAGAPPPPPPNGTAYAAPRPPPPAWRPAKAAETADAEADARPCIHCSHFGRY